MNVSALVQYIAVVQYDRSVGRWKSEPKEETQVEERGGGGEQEHAFHGRQKQARARDGMLVMRKSGETVACDALILNGHQGKLWSFLHTF